MLRSTLERLGVGKGAEVDSLDRSTGDKYCLIVSEDLAAVFKRHSEQVMATRMLCLVGSRAQIHKPFASWGFWWHPC